ncbi:MAG: hypothetical protein ACR2P3_01360, partial [Geminicoccaceae bacterium]
IHRLARARADTIQTSLIENGLPAASIASVWDWRFMVQQARVTLWVFRLTAGDDCEDSPIGSQAEDRIAAVASPEAPEQRASSSAAEAPVIAKADANPAASVKQQVIPAAKPRNTVVTAPIPAAPSRAKKKEDAKKAVGAASTPKAASSSEPRTVALDPNTDSDPNGSAKLVDKGALEIVFATNSSYFPENAGAQLRAFMKTLNKDKSYILRIQTSIDGDAGVSGASSANEAARYNTWLAERRFKRVEAWILKNSDGRNLSLEPSLVENDGSRRVRIEPNPSGNG